MGRPVTGLIVMEQLKDTYQAWIVLEVRLRALSAAHLKEARKRAGLTCKDVASRIGYTDAYVSMVENGKAPCTAPYFVKFYEGLLLPKE